MSIIFPSIFHFIAYLHALQQCTLQVNTNGFISFGQSLKHLRPTSFPLESVDIIAPFWTEIDISKSGNVFFQEVVDNEVMEKINDDIKTAYPSLTSFRVHWAFIATWENVSIYNHISNNQEVNYV